MTDDADAMTCAMSAEMLDVQANNTEGTMSDKKRMWKAWAVANKKFGSSPIYFMTIHLEKIDAKRRLVDGSEDLRMFPVTITESTKRKGKR